MTPGIQGCLGKQSLWYSNESRLPWPEPPCKDMPCHVCSGAAGAHGGTKHIVGAQRVFVELRVGGSCLP